MYKVDIVVFNNLMLGTTQMILETIREMFGDERAYEFYQADPTIYMYRV